MDKIRVFIMIRACLLAIIIIGSLPSPAMAGRQNMYSVSGVSVDITAKSVKEAKKEAFEKGKVDAFKILLQRLTRQSHTSVELTSSQMESFVHSSVIENEKHTGVRYIAKLTFNFTKSKIEDFLTDQGIDFSAYEIKPVLIIPIKQKADHFLLWEAENEKLNEWSGNLHHSALISFELPEGNLQDIQDLSAQEALDQNAVEVSKLIARYNTEGAVLVTHKANDTVEMFFVTATGDGHSVPLIGVEDGQKPNYTQISQSIETFVRSLSTLEDAGRSHLKVAVHVKDQRGWIQARRHLKHTPGVKSLKVDAMSAKKIDVVIDFVGNVERLQKSMESQKLKLERLENGDWAISPDGV